MIIQPRRQNRARRRVVDLPATTKRIDFARVPVSLCYIKCTGATAAQNTTLYDGETAVHVITPSELAAGYLWPGSLQYPSLQRDAADASVPIRVTWDDAAGAISSLRSGVIVASMQSGENSQWSRLSGPSGLAIDTSVRKFGLQSLRIAASNTADTIAQWNPAATLDLRSLGNYLSCWVYIPNPAQISSLRLIACRDNPGTFTNFASYTWTPDTWTKTEPRAWTAGWNFLQCWRSEMAAFGTFLNDETSGGGWANVRWLGLSVQANVAGPVLVRFERFCLEFRQPVLSIEADDGLRSIADLDVSGRPRDYTYRRICELHGLRMSWFVEGSAIDTANPKYATPAELLAMSAEGHVIGGHFDGDPYRTGYDSRWTDYATGYSASAVVSSITRVGSTATVTTMTAHGLNSGAVIRVQGATQPEYNASQATITVTGSTSFTYVVSGTPATPATGSPSYVVGEEPGYYTVAQIRSDMQSMKGRLAGWGLDLPYHFGASQGHVNRATDTAMRAEYASSRKNSYPASFGTQRSPMPVFDIGGYMFSGIGSATPTGLATARGWIDDMIARGGGGCVVGHNGGETVDHAGIGILDPAAGWDPFTKFKPWCAYLADKRDRGLIDVLTRKELLLLGP